MERQGARVGARFNLAVTICVLRNVGTGSADRHPTPALTCPSIIPFSSWFGKAGEVNVTAAAIGRRGSLELVGPGGFRNLVCENPHPVV